ncbi:sulfate transporter family-domain-containing protein [Schizophyllum amplum]|uniref:Sulfate transporter family-domain-containing protein n=1 Tax=Schizophyllum amplum TaxID=97359 RepID=A0A550CA88_9AGAR|nr:sulfate transporter family-domain-containing protein [Auriculariopsis ampla]
MSAAEKAKNLGKRVIGYEDDVPPAIDTVDWIKESIGNPWQSAVGYATSLFPILSWLPRYNLGWFYGDVVAGLTVGMVLVPQGMSYAQIATLSPEYGLYSSFVGVLIYCIFATSKDVSIGPVAVMSLTVAQIIREVDAAAPGQFSGPQVGNTLSFICGFIVLAIGMLRLGWLIEFIPAPAVAGFMTGSAISIATSQLPGLFGLSGFDTRAETFRVIIESLKHLPKTKVDAAFGLPALVFLYAVRFGCEKLSKRWPRYSRIIFFISVLRNAFVILVLTIASWLYTRSHLGPDQDASLSPIKILGEVPRGFQQLGRPEIDPELLKVIAGQLPVATIILLLEHVAIAKSFGRINGYKINPNQELIAIGVTNTVGSCFGAYPATGSFSRSALTAKCGVRTPASGLASALVVLVALYGLTPAFFWIPSAALSAVIIHAVADLVTPPAQVYQYWRISPVEFVIWVAAVLCTIFATIEDGIYVAICASLAFLLIRVAHPRGKFLGKVNLKSDSSAENRDAYVPLTDDGVKNPAVDVSPPAPGVIVYRFEESYLYPNQHVFNSALVDRVHETTRRGKDMSNVSYADRPWNDPGPKSGTAREDDEKLPLLYAVVLDFSPISHVDTTAVQTLIDTRAEIERWADRPVEFHFATITSPWVRRALIAGGFGFSRDGAQVPHEIAPVVPYRDSEARTDSMSSDTKDDLESGNKDSKTVADVTEVPISSSGASSVSSNYETIMRSDTPFFHVDLTAAIRAAERSAERAREDGTVML